MSALEGDFEEKEFSRAKCDFKSLSTRFELCTRDFKMQYASLYRTRYERCLPALRKRVDKEWGTSSSQFTTGRFTITQLLYIDSPSMSTANSFRALKEFDEILCEKEMKNIVFIGLRKFQLHRVARLRRCVIFSVGHKL